MSWLRRILGRDEGRGRRVDGEDEAPLRQGFELQFRGRLEEAQAAYRRALEADPANADALYLLAQLALADRRETEGIALLQEAAALRPRDAVILSRLAESLLETRQFAESRATYDACLALQPDCVSARVNHSATLIELGERELARVALEALTREAPHLPELLFNLAGIYREYGLAEDAIDGYRRSLALVPGHAPTMSNLLLELNYSDRRTGAEVFAEHLAFGERYGRRAQPPAADRRWPRVLRVGYVSPDFRGHVVARFVEPIIERHDRSRFHVTCYHVHRGQDRVTERFRRLADVFVDAAGLEDDELAARIREDRIDLLVDLAGHTAGNRLLAFSTKPAPVQATYLGYPNTTGMGAFDYRITDARADPPGESDRLSVERLVRLPGTYFCFRPEDLPAVAPLPALRGGQVTFGCFNAYPKLSHAFFDAAARVLRAVPGSRLLLKSRPLSVPAVADALRARLLGLGVRPEQLEIRGWEASTRGHLDIYNQVDIALDSFPYNGATTTCEALCMGVPVVTLTGDRHAARVGSSLLEAVGLPELVAADVDGYVAAAARLAGDVPALARLRAGLRERVRRSPLMDEPAFVRNLEAAYVAMWEAHLARSSESPADSEAILWDAWNAAFDAGTPGLVLDRLNAAIVASGGTAKLHYMLGCVLHAQGKLEDAAAAFRASLAMDAADAKAHNNLGCVLEAAGDLDGADRCYREAIARDARNAHAHYNLGNLFRQRGALEDAVASMSRAIALDPRHADWLSNLGSLHGERLELEESIARLREAVAIDPAFADAHASLGVALLRTGRLAQAREAVRRALELAPDQAHLESQWLLWGHYDEGMPRAVLREAHVDWARRHLRSVMRAGQHASLDDAPGERMRVGYVASDFSRPDVAAVMEALLAAHDRSRVEVFCYTNAPEPGPAEERLLAQADHGLRISAMQDALVADGLRAHRLHVLVDLAGHSAGHRLPIFARKPAPVQFSWLGYPDVTGLAAMDGRLVDAGLRPPGAGAGDPREPYVLLPGSAMCFAEPGEAPEPGPLPSATHGRITFGVFAEPACITPSQVSLWGRVLDAQPDSRLIVRSPAFGTDAAARVLKERFAAAGIDGARIDCGGERDAAARLAALAEADVILDTNPWSPALAAFEALWMGVPVITRPGDTEASRGAAAVLGHAGLHAWIARDEEHYVHLARELAGAAGERLALRRTLRERLRRSPLMDAASLARALESVFRTALDRARAAARA